MKRRRRLFEPTVTHEWEAERDEQLQRYISSGLGVRPEEWWLYDSGRPDLADGAGDDTYAHLEPFAGAERAAERLRWLAANGLLTEAEWTAIRAAERDLRQPHYQARRWRLAVLTDSGL